MKYQKKIMNVEVLRDRLILGSCGLSQVTGCITTGTHNNTLVLCRDFICRERTERTKKQSVSTRVVVPPLRRVHQTSALEFTSPKTSHTSGSMWMLQGPNSDLPFSCSNTWLRMAARCKLLRAAEVCPHPNRKRKFSFEF